MSYWCDVTLAVSGIGAVVAAAFMIYLPAGVAATGLAATVAAYVRRLIALNRETD